MYWRQFGIPCPNFTFNFVWGSKEQLPATIKVCQRYLDKFQWIR